MTKLCCFLTVLSYPVLVAATPIDTVPAPTMGEGALLAAVATLPLVGAAAIRRRLRRRRDR